MTSNIDKYKKDLDQLILNGNNLLHAIQFECHPDEFEAQVKKHLKEKYNLFIKTLPSFKDKYQIWYSESLAIVKLLLPDRIGDLVKLYEKPKIRKKVEYGNYVIEDYLQGLKVTRGWEKEKIVGPNQKSQSPQSPRLPCRIPLVL